MFSNKKYSRRYSSEYLAFGFIESLTDKQLPFCLLCHRTLSNEAMKPSRMVAHLTSQHKKDKEKPLEYFQDLYEKFKNRHTITASFKKQSAKNKDGLTASYRMSKLIAKSGRSHNIGETLLIPSIQEYVSTVMHQDPTDDIKTLALSDTTVSRRIDEMAVDVESQLVTILQTTSFSIQLDESTITDNNALLMAYVRYFNENSVLQEEMLFVQNLITDTKGVSIFTAVKSYLEKNNIPLTNIISCATDGAPSMVGRYRGFIAYLKKEVPNVICIHCVIHRQHLASKNLSISLHSSLNIIISVINKIKANAKNDRMFRQLCHDNDEQFVRLLLHTEVRWLSKGACLTRFIELYESVVQFLEDQNEVDLLQKLKLIKNDACYLAGIFKKCNDCNLQLQGANMTLINCQKVISLFIEKLDLFSHNLSKMEFHQFPELLSIKDDITTIDTQRFIDHLNKLKTDFKTRFNDVLTMEVYDWMINPFTANITEVDVLCQEELLQLRYDDESKGNFNSGGYIQLWQNKKMSNIYPNMWKKIFKLLITFPTSYLVESGFSAVNHILTKHRNALKITERGDIRLFLTKFEPNILNLVSKHQAQGSH